MILLKLFLGSRLQRPKPNDRKLKEIEKVESQPSDKTPQSPSKDEAEKIINEVSDTSLPKT